MAMSALFLSLLLMSGVSLSAMAKEAIVTLTSLVWLSPLLVSYDEPSVVRVSVETSSLGAPSSQSIDGKDNSRPKSSRFPLAAAAVVVVVGER